MCLLHWDVNITYIARVREYETNRCEGKYDMSLNEVHSGGGLSLEDLLQPWTYGRGEKQTLP
jgi:hypothetical protein